MKYFVSSREETNVWDKSDFLGLKITLGYFKARVIRVYHFNSLRSFGFVLSYIQVIDYESKPKYIFNELWRLVIFYLTLNKLFKIKFSSTCSTYLQF